MSHRKKTHSKPKIIFVLSLIISLVLVLRLFTLTRPLSSQESYQSIIIPKSSSASEVSQLFKDKQLIRSPLAFKLYLRFTSQQSQIQAGSHRLSPHLSFKEIAHEITSSPEGIWITFPEGWRREQYAEELSKTFIKDSSFQAQTFLDQTQQLEGQLFPDTYLFPTNASTELIIKTLTNTFNQKISEIFSNLQNHLTQDQTLVLASILERETITNEEKPIVAGILIKRLENDWPLQADATIQYAIASNQQPRGFDSLDNTNLDRTPGVNGNGTDKQSLNWWPQNLTAQDLTINSPFNTYTNPGLPPTPICNPGRESNQPAPNPEKSPYWFYLHDPQGQIHYATTLEDHHANIAKYLD